MLPNGSEQPVGRFDVLATDAPADRPQIVKFVSLNTTGGLRRRLLKLIAVLTISRECCRYEHKAEAHDSNLTSAMTVLGTAEHCSECSKRFQLESIEQGRPVVEWIR